MPRWSVAAAGILALAVGCPPAPPAAAQQTTPAAPAATTRDPGARPVPHPVTPPERFQRAVREGTRTATGVPGPRYWQQWTSYRLNALLDVQRKQLFGTGRIVYHNRSPDTLAMVFLHLYQNYNAPGAVRNDVAEDPAGPVTLTRLAAQGVTLREGGGGGPGYVVAGTTARVRPPRPLAPGDSLVLEAEWSFRIPQNMAERAGWSGDDLFFLAYWYPQMSVYDDVAGWHLDQHLGLAEFYMGYGSYDVTVEAPEGWVVAATGELRNEAEVLPEPVLERLRRARGSDQVVHVLTAADFGPGRATRDVPSDRLRWRFHADSVRDFAFSATRQSLWDAMRAPAGDRDGDGRTDFTVAHALYRARATAWAGAAGIVRHSVAESARLTGFPYPWSHMTAVEGEGIISGGMEYPMLTLTGALSGGGSDIPIFTVLFHEVLHMWVPMIVGTDETRYGWMDEGLTSYGENLAVMQRFPDQSPLAGDHRAYAAIARSGTEGEIMRWSDFHYNDAAFGVASYQKPAVVLFALRTILGEETFQRGYREFIRRWAYRHPTPWDFFNAMEAAAGRDLDWFWTPWFFTTWTLDQAIAAVAQEAGGATVTIRDLGNVPMPVLLRITRENGETLDREVPVESWLGGERTATVRIPAGSPVTRVEIDPSGTFPDIDRRNNIWTR
ncbi:MAG TPA: M1 family metallopeptidase [Longimicrobiaceae bacterium]|nr:M1 family metallopeptidase [Longimicrobiaceae bacterium]